MTEQEQPTEAQIKEFWEWCGLTRIKRGWKFPDGDALIDCGNPPIDLNNLFKYAVPKLFTWSIGKNWELQDDLTIKENGIKASVDLHWVDPNKYDQIKASEAISETPALALFWAIWEVIKNDKQPD